MKKFIIAAAIFAFLPLFASAYFDTDLAYGSKGEGVRELQEFLIDQGVLNTAYSGNFYSLTLRAVKAFQIKQSISPASGYFGPKTRAKANDLLAASGVSKDSIATEEGMISMPIAVPSKTTNDTVSSLTDQIKLLQQQLALLQQNQSTLQQKNQQLTQQTQALQQQSQALQQIQQQTAPSPLPPPPLIIVTASSQSQERPSATPEPAPPAPAEPVSVPTPVPQSTHTQTSTSPSNPSPSSNSVVDQYSSYNFDYQWNEDKLTCPMTLRNIVIKKAVFQVPESELQMVNTLRGFETDGFKLVIQQKTPILVTEITSPGTNRVGRAYYNLEASDQNTFVYFSDNMHLLPGICRDEGTATISSRSSATLTDITDQGRNIFIYLSQVKGISDRSRTGQMDIRVSPIMSKWEVWDGTENKPVKIK